MSLQNEGDTASISNASSSVGEEPIDSISSNNPGVMWRILLESIRRGFPNAKQLSTGKLAELMKNENSMQHLLLLDVRENEEFAVSSIDGALNINPDGSEKDLVLEKICEKSQDKSKKVETIVCFCSVGYRSAKMAQSLQKQLQNNKEPCEVFNLEGSLFKWANEGRPMVDRLGNKTLLCHPYSSVWGKFLNSELRTYTASM